jgi:hypothetical protein
MENKSYEICPFCGEQNFDLVELKNHLLLGKCESFYATGKQGFDRPIITKDGVNINKALAAESPMWVFHPKYPQGCHIIQYESEKIPNRWQAWFYQDNDCTEEYIENLEDCYFSEEVMRRMVENPKFSIKNIPRFRDTGMPIHIHDDAYVHDDLSNVVKVFIRGVGDGFVLWSKDGSSNTVKDISDNLFSNQFQRKHALNNYSSLNCPKCNAEPDIQVLDPEPVCLRTTWKCGTYTEGEKVIHESEQCLRNQKILEK